MCYFCDNIRKVKENNTLERKHGEGNKLIIADLYGTLRFFRFGTSEYEDEIYRDCYVNFCPQCGKQLKNYIQHPVWEHK